MPHPKDKPPVFVDYGRYKMKNISDAKRQLRIFIQFIQILFFLDCVVGLARLCKFKPLIFRPFKGIHNQIMMQYEPQILDSLEELIPAGYTLTCLYEKSCGAIVYTKGLFCGRPFA